MEIGLTSTYQPHQPGSSGVRRCARDVGIASIAKTGSRMESFLVADFLGKPAWMWLGFISVVFALLAFDLGVLHRKSKEIEVTESLLLSAVYISIGVAFGAWVWWYLGPQSGMEYMTGFAIEKTLAMDNVFVIAMIFTYFAIPRIYQHRVLFWGILGVIVLRAIMIGIGAPIVENFSWVLYIFAVFLILTGIKMMWVGDKETDISANPALLWMKRRFNVTEELHGEKFFVKKPDPQTGKPVSFMTPLFLSLVLIEFADVIFAVDSGAGNLPHHHRPVHRLHVEHLRNPGPARALLCSRRDGRAVQVSEVCPLDAVDLYRLEDLHRLGLGLGEVSAGLGSRHYRRDPGKRHLVQSLADAR